MRKFINKYIGILLLTFSIIIGLINYDKYGIAWDEVFQHQTGEINNAYTFSNSKDLLTFIDKDYGVAFELPLIIIEKICGSNDSRVIYLTRHIITHIFFLLGAFFCFLLINFIHKNKLLASIGFLLIILCPQMYGHSYFNTKDIPFASMFLICFYLNAKAFSSQKTIYYLLLGIGVGLLINLRIMGVLLFCCILFFLILDFFIPQKEDNIGFKKRTKLVLTFLFATIFTLYISWPYLWENPITNFLSVFKNMSHFRWAGTVLFEGQFVKASDVPWFYIPVWFSITTPFYYLLAGFGGTILLLIHFIKTPFLFLSNSKQRNYLFFSICFFAPFIAIIILKSVVYDGWRQMFFIYPSFALLIVYCFNFLVHTKFKTILISITFIYFGYISYFMITNNPFQSLYFNELTDTKTPNYLRGQFDIDYWGISYRQALEYILKTDKSPEINVTVANTPGKYNIKILPVESRTRIHFVDINEAKYFITNFRWHPEEYKEFQRFKWYSIKVKNNTINEIYKLR